MIVEISVVSALTAISWRDKRFAAFWALSLLSKVTSIRFPGRVTIPSTAAIEIEPFSKADKRQLFGGLILAGSLLLHRCNRLMQSRR